MKRNLVLAALVLVLVLLAGCVPGPNDLVETPDEEGEVAGFWQGLWQGFIAPFTFLISLFSENVHIYEVHNNGGWYDFGFLIGLSAIFGGGGRGSKRRSRH